MCQAKAHVPLYAKNPSMSSQDVACAGTSCNTCERAQTTTPRPPSEASGVIATASETSMTRRKLQQSSGTCPAGAAAGTITSSRFGGLGGLDSTWSDINCTGETPHESSCLVWWFFFFLCFIFMYTGILFYFILLYITGIFQPMYAKGFHV
jgi:hypothetical protein